ncbi:hypothetical protein ACFLTW_05100, partial [Chloroflexota bacterium]
AKKEAEQTAKEKAKQDAIASKKAKEAEEIAKKEAERAVKEKVKRDAEEAKQEAIEAKRAKEAEEKAKKEAEKAAKEKVKREPEEAKQAEEPKENVKQDAEEAKQAEKRAKKEAEQTAKEKAKQDAIEAKERAKQEAIDAKKAKEAEEKAKKEAEKAAKEKAKQISNRGAVKEVGGAQKVTANTSLGTYKGEVKLKVSASVDFGKQVREFNESLKQVEGLEISWTGGSADEGTIIAVSLQTPMPLIDILNKIPIVDKIEIRGESILVTL